MSRAVDSQIEVGKALIRRCAKTWDLPGFENRAQWEWSSRLKRDLGRAYPQRSLVRLSTRLQAPEYAAYFEAVLCHEIAHLAVFDIHGARAASHGVEWRSLVRKAGFVPRPTLTLETEEKTNEPGVLYEHVCPVCQALRVSRRPQPAWRCVECCHAGLSGELIVQSRPTQIGGGHV